MRLADEIIVVVEDDDDDFFFAERVLRKVTAAPIIHIPSGRAAIAYLGGTPPYDDRRRHPMPVWMFLDLKMDQGSGLEVLDWIQANLAPPLPKIFVLSGSNEPKDRDVVKRTGVTAGYIVKPLSLDHAQAILGRP